MKKILSIAFSLLLAIPVAMAGFADLIPKHSYYEAINFIQARGIVSGYPDGSFQADRQINRYELLKIVIESAYSDTAISMALDEYKALNYYYVDLKDVPMGEWFSPYVRIGIQDKVIQGYPDGFFRGTNSVNFVEALQIMMQTYKVDYDEGATLWYKDMVDVAAEKNLIPLDIVAFNQGITRGQMAEMITRMIKYNQGTLDDYLGKSGLIKQTFEKISEGKDQLAILDFLLQNVDKIEPKPACSDGVDNDDDSILDAQDPGCHTDNDASNANSYDPNDDDETDEPEESENKPQCSDGLDNDNDGRTDAEDAGCWADVSDKNSYNPNDDVEDNEPLCVDGKDNDNDGLKDAEDPGCHTDGDPKNATSYDPTDEDEVDVLVDPEPGFNDTNEANAQLLVDAIEAFAVNVGLYPGLPDQPECLVNAAGAGLDLTVYIQGGVIPNTPKPNQDLQVGDLFCAQTYFYTPLKFGGEIRKGYVLIAPMTDPNRANFLLSDIDTFPENSTAEDVIATLNAYDKSKIADAEMSDRVLILTN